MKIELIKLFLMVGLLLFFYAKNRFHIVFAIVIASSFLGGINPNIITDIWAVHFIGLIFLIQLIKNPIINGSKKYINPILIWMLLLVMLGVVYGWIIPWPDLTGERSFNQRSQGRSIIYTVGIGLQILSFLFFISKNTSLREKGIAINFIIYFSIMCAIFTFVEIVGFDIFNSLNPSNERSIGYQIDGRARGINGEPRVNSQILAYGLVTILIFWKGKYKYFLISIVSIAFLYSMSLSGFIFLLVALFFMISSLDNLTKNLGKTIFITLPLLALLYTQSQYIPGLDSMSSFFKSKSSSIEDRGLLEVFDASAIEFFKNNPKYVVFGVGPGLISLPASEYIPNYAQAIYGYRIDSIPHMGIIQVISNTGLVGLSLILYFFYNVMSLVYINEKDRKLPEGSAKYVLILIFLYLLQYNLFIFSTLGFFLSSKDPKIAIK